MLDQKKDIIAANIESRAKRDLGNFKAELHKIFVKNLESRRDSDSYFYGSNELITGKPAEIIERFLTELEPHIKKFHTDKKEREFSEILTNLASYLEMINH